MPTQQFNNYANLITFTRASSGTALRPISYGAEILPNGDFSQGSTGWSVGTGWSVSGGVATHTGAIGTIVSTPATAFTIGSYYIIEFDYSGNTDVFAIYLRGVNVTGSNINTASGHFKGVGIAGTNTGEGLSILATAGLVVDNFSVKQVIFDQAGDPLTLFNHPNNVPRIEYDANGNRLGLLIEEARTNLMPYSEDFSNAAWVKTQATVSVQPDGSYFLTDNVVSDVHQISLPASTTVVGAYSYSVDFKAESLSSVRLVSTGAGMSTQTTQFNLSLGQVVGGSGSVTDLGGGWYRCTQFFTTLSTGFVTTRIRLDKAGSDNYAGSGESISLRRVQFELGAFSTSYIPTTGAAATRAVDIASISTSAFGYNVTAGTFVARVNQPLANRVGARRYIWNILDGGNNRLSGRASDTGNVEPTWAYGTGVTVENITIPVTTGPSHSTALAYSSQNGIAALNGTLSTLRAGYAGIPQTTLNIGQVGTGQICGYITSIQYYPRQLSPAQIQELTR